VFFVKQKSTGGLTGAVYPRLRGLSSADQLLRQTHHITSLYFFEDYPNSQPLFSAFAAAIFASAF